MNTSTKKSEGILCLARNPRLCMVQISGNTVKQVDKFKYLRVAITSDGRRYKELDTRIGKSNTVLRELYRSVTTKRELSNTAKLSVFKSVFVPILTYGHDSWVMTERVLSQVQVVEMGFFQGVHVMALRDKVVSCEIGNALNDDPLLVRIERSQLGWFGHVTKMLQDRLTGWKRLRGRPGTRWNDYISDLAWSRLGVEPAKLSEVAEKREVFGALLGLLFSRPGFYFFAETFRVICPTTVVKLAITLFTSLPFQIL